MNVPFVFHFPASSTAPAAELRSPALGRRRRGMSRGAAGGRRSPPSDIAPGRQPSGGGQSPHTTVSAASRPPSPAAIPQRYSSSAASAGVTQGMSSCTYRARPARTGAAAGQRLPPPGPQRSKTAAFCRPPGQRISSRLPSRARAAAGRDMALCLPVLPAAGGQHRRRRSGGRRRHAAHAATEQPGGGRDSPSHRQVMKWQTVPMLMVVISVFCPEVM